MASPVLPFQGAQRLQDWDAAWHRRMPLSSPLFAHGTLDVRGTSRPLTFDTTLRDVVKPWLSLPQRLRGWLLVSR